MSAHPNTSRWSGKRGNDTAQYLADIQDPESPYWENQAKVIRGLFALTDVDDVTWDYLAECCKMLTWKRIYQAYREALEAYKRTPDASKEAIAFAAGVLPD